MNRTGDRGADPQGVPIYFSNPFLHKEQKYEKATVLQNINWLSILN